MPELRLYNSLSRRVEEFVPQQPLQVRVYHCGPTVYKRPHLGNMRRFLVADFLRRTLEYFGYTVREITNITDVGHLTQDEIDAGEDKLEREARAQRLTPRAIADRVTEQFFTDLAALNVKRSDEYPRATEHIAVMQEVIAQLLQRGHAYRAASGVYFHVPSFPAYGKLSGNTLAQLAAGARVEIRAEKRHPADFALWKIDDPSHVQQWDSPWGRGYPGWHIECSAMAMAYLGETLDIHTGGEDLKFPHHENEIAQSEAATGKPFARWWIHNALLTVGGVKAAKRAGDVLTLDAVRERGYSPLAFRLLSFGSHYRSPLDFSWSAMDQATANLQTLQRLLQRLDGQARAAGGGAKQSVLRSFAEALAADLNTPEALAVVLAYVRNLNTRLGRRPSRAAAREAWATLRRLDTVLGIFLPLAAELSSVAAPAEVARLVQQREQARAAKDFGQADVLRAAIEQRGWHVEDTPHGPRLIPE